MEQIEDRMLNEREASEYLGVSVVALRALRSTGASKRGLRPVPYFKIGRNVRYKLRELATYLEGCRAQEPAA